MPQWFANIAFTQLRGNPFLNSSAIAAELASNTLPVGGYRRRHNRERLGNLRDR